MVASILKRPTTDRRRAGSCARFMCSGTRCSCVCVGTGMLKVEVSPGADERVARLAVLPTPMGDKWPKLRPPLLKPWR